MDKNRIIKNGRETVLSDLKVGQIGKVIGIYIKEPEIKRHLLDMGITKGTKILIKKISPLGNPIDIELRGYELCMRKEDLKCIYVEVIK